MFTKPAAAISAELAPLRRSGLMKTLLSVDAALIVVNLVLGAFFLAGMLGRVPKPWRLETEINIGSIYTFFKWLTLAAILYALGRRTREFVHFALAGIFLFLLLDDTLRFHENLGNVIEFRLSPTPRWGMAGDDIGELFVLGLMGLGVLATLTAAFRRSGPGTRAEILSFGLLFLLLGFAGVVLDVLHAAAGISPVTPELLKLLLGIAEDGGEMVVASLMLGYAQQLASA